MSVSSGPKLVTSGLEFGYDMTNISKSWLGAPTTNYVITQAWGGDYAGNVFTQTVTDQSLQYRNLPTSKLLNTSTSFNCYINGGNLNQTLASTAWTFLCYIRRADRQPIPALATYLYTFSSDNASATVTQLEDGWYRVYRTKTGTSAAASLAGFTGLLQNVEYYISGASLTPTTHHADRLTVNASRASTQSVLDSTRKNTITATSLTYASDGTFSFNGSSNYLSIPNTTLGNGNIPWTVSCWMKTTATDNALGFGSILSNISGGPVYSMMGVNNGKIVYWTYQNSAWAQKLGVGKTVNDGAWHMLTWVNYSNYTMDMYVDGLLDSNVPNSTSGNNNPVDVIGRSWAAYFAGSIASVSRYTQSLTASEVLQNFEAHRSRYGI
jgi:hypothetical protein